MYLIKNATVYTMADDKVREHTDILCDKGKIAKIGKDLEAKGAKVLDASGLVVTPGLIDAHVHTGGFDLASPDLNEATDPNTAQLDALAAIDIHSNDFKELHKRGVTSACFIPGSANVVCGTGFVAKTAGKNSIEELAVLHPAVMKCAMGWNPKGYGKRGQAPQSRMGVADIFRSALRTAQQYRDKKIAAGDDKDKLPPYDAKSEALIPVLEKKLPLKVHCEQFDMLTVIAIAKEFDCDYTLEHGWACNLYVDELVKGGGPVNFGPIGIAEGYGELTGGDVAYVKALDDKGLTVSLITDGPIYAPQVLLISAGEAVRYGISHHRALRMVTINPATALRVADRLGSIEEGKDADLVVWNGVPALETKAKPLYTIIDGEVVYKA
ncbi:MAG: amidohydrolase family protein [Erysipelotrichaceae bacterium]|jgi:imidazolonepropionase-like amidohydrolase|nr:amidohydrolase family protein [Erysipelotrichaceae bacterium]